MIDANDKRAWLRWVRSRFGPKSHVRHVLREIAEWMNDDARNAYPTQETIAEGIGTTPRAARDSIAEAVRELWLRIERRKRGRGRHGYANTYVATYPDHVHELIRAGHTRPPARAVPEHSPEQPTGSALPLGQTAPMGSGLPLGQRDQQEAERRPRGSTAYDQEEVHRRPKGSGLPPTSLNDSLNERLDIHRENGAAAPRSINADEVGRLFEHWKATHGHESAKLTPNRRKIIGDALKLYSFEDLYRSIGGYSYSKFHKGDNDSGQRFDSIEIFFKDAARIEHGIQLWHNPPETQQ